MGIRCSCGCSTRWTVVVLCMLAAAGCGIDRANDPRAGDAPKLSKAPTIGVATFPSIERLVPRVDPARGGTSIHLNAARGEFEAGQLVVHATSVGRARLAVRTHALTGPGGATIAASSITPYRELVMTVERGSPAGRSGRYTDPLVPMGNGAPVSTDTPLLAWVDVQVPVQAAPGRYTGQLEIIRTDTKPHKELARVPMTVTVRRATIPKVPTLKSNVGFDLSQMVRFEGVRSGSVEQRRVTERYAAMLADARLSIADVGVTPPGVQQGHVSRPGDAAFFSRVFNRRGVASVRIPFYSDHPFADPLGRDRQATVAYFRAAARWARANGWLDRSYVYVFDEPNDADAGAVRELHELLREADPALRLLVTREASAKAFQGSVDIWSPNINPSRYRAEDVSREHRAGRETWFYPSITTYAPYPTLFIDELRPAPRALGWHAARDGVDGILYWTATHWQQVEDPYSDPGTYKETDVVGNGDGVLMYPGGPLGQPGHPVPGVRLLQLRDGIEDHDLITLATCAGTPQQRAAIRRALLAVVPSITDSAPTPAQVESLRAVAFAVLDARPVPAGCA